MKFRFSQILICFLVLTLGSCASKPPSDPPPKDRQPAAIREKLVSNPASNLRCEDVFEAVRSKPKTLLGLLKKLRRKSPDYFSHYVLLPNSMSLHGSDFAHPRAVVSGGDARMMISFNGDPSQKAYERLEMACFRVPSNQYEFYEITFPREALNVAAIEDLTPAERAMPVVVSPVNGGPSQDCRRCHQTPLRPNWDTYKLWPSAFGANDDELFRRDHRSHTKTTLALDQAEIAAYKMFSFTGRYAVLGKNASETPNTIFGSKLSYDNGQRIVAELQRLGKPFEKIKVDFARALWCPVRGVEKRLFAAEDNGQLGMYALTTRVSKTAMNMISESGGYAKEKYDRLKQYFGQSFENPYVAQGAAKSVNEHYARLGFDPNEGVYIQEALGAEFTTVLRLERMNELLSPLGIDVRNWSMILHGGYLFEDGDGGIGGGTLETSLEAPFLSTFFSRDSRLKTLVIDRRDENLAKDEKSILSRDEAICGYLKGI